MINIKQGIYDIALNEALDYSGFFHKETQKYIPMCVKLRDHLETKGRKFSSKYDANYVIFTYGIDPAESIETISICHPVFDDFHPELGESIVIGRISRMRGDLKKRFYQTQFVFDEEGNKTKKKELKLDSNNKPIVRREVYHKPYDLDRRYPDIKHRDGTIEKGALMYPYVYKFRKEGDP